LQTPVPVRVFVLKTTKGWTIGAPVFEGRTTQNIVLDEKMPPGAALYTELTRLFLASNIGRMPASFEHGLVEFFSTLQVNGIRITVGTPPAGGAPDLDWARIHLLVTDPEYFGKIRVLLFNLRKGVADDPAYRNAFGKPAAEVEAQAKQHLAAGNFQTTSLSSRPLSEKDFTERQVSDTDARLARAEVLKARELDYTRAARAAGASTPRILVRHLLPNAFAPLLVSASFGVAYAILAEAALSFLGVGLPAPAASWGGILSVAPAYIGEAWWMALFPGVALFLTVSAYNLLAEGLRRTSTETGVVG